MARTHYPERRRRLTPLRLAEDLILGFKYVTVLAMLVAVFLMAAYTYSIAHEAWNLALEMFKGEVSEAETVIGILAFVDGLMVLTTVYLIVGGSFQIYVAKEHDQRELPSALQNLSSGRLKEKLSSSLITVSAVYLLKVVIQLGTNSEGAEAQVTLSNFVIMGTIHLLFIIGYGVIAYSNRKDPHHASHHDPADEQARHNGTATEHAHH